MGKGEKEGCPQRILQERLALVHPMPEELQPAEGKRRVGVGLVVGRG
jgi:hypothetical protein